MTRIVTCNIGDSAHEVSATCTITVTVDSSTTGTLTNHASVSGHEANSDISNNLTPASADVLMTAPASTFVWGLIVMASAVV